jgi:hypothetical protein
MNETTRPGMEGRMSEESKKVARTETIQNWTIFSLLAAGIVLAVTTVGPWSLYLIGVGLVLGLFFIIKRTLPKRPSLLTIIAMLSGLYLPVSFWLLMAFPGVYGVELDALFTWVVSLLVASSLAIIATTIELFRTSKAR